MKHSKLIILGLTAAMTIGGANAVFAQDIAEAGTSIETSAQEETTDTTSSDKTEKTEAESTTGKEKTAKTNKGTRPAMKQGEKPADMPEGEAPDMSGLKLPEGFVPFDEEHVPDGKNAPEGGELKPIEFDENGEMIFGQKPEGIQGERPELPEGEAPDGELPEGASFKNNQRPFGGRMPMGMPKDGKQAQNSEDAGTTDTEKPELPDGTAAPTDGELPEMTFDENGRPELPERPDFAQENQEGRPEAGTECAAPSNENGEQPGNTAPSSAPQDAAVPQGNFEAENAPQMPQGEGFEGNGQFGEAPAGGFGDMQQEAEMQPNGMQF